MLQFADICKGRLRRPEGIRARREGGRLFLRLRYAERNSTGGLPPGRRSEVLAGRAPDGGQAGGLLLLAGVIGEAFGNPVGIPLLPVVFGCEIDSCYGNYFGARGEKLKVNIFRFLGRRTGILEPEPDKERLLKPNKL